MFTKNSNEVYWYNTRNAGYENYYWSFISMTKERYRFIKKKKQFFSLLEPQSGINSKRIFYSLFLFAFI